MRSWFHFLPICLLLALSGPAAAVPTEPLVLGAEDDWYPYTAYKDGRIQGMSADIVRAAFRAADTPVQLNPYPYSRCMKLALKGLIAGCFNTSPNPHILADYRLPRHPLFRAEIQLWARRDEARPVNAEQALSGRKVAVTLGYEYGDGFDRRHDLVRIPVRKDYYGFLMLQRGRVDYALAYRNTARQLFSEHPELEGQFQPVPRSTARSCTCRSRAATRRPSICSNASTSACSASSPAASTRRSSTAGARPPTLRPSPTTLTGAQHRKEPTWPSLPS